MVDSASPSSTIHGEVESVETFHMVTAHAAKQSEGDTLLYRRGEGVIKLGAWGTAGVERGRARHACVSIAMRCAIAG